MEIVFYTHFVPVVPHFGPFWRLFITFFNSTHTLPKTIKNPNKPSEHANYVFKTIKTSKAISTATEKLFNSNKRQPIKFNASNQNK